MGDWDLPDIPAPLYESKHGTWNEVECRLHGKMLNGEPEENTANNAKIFVDR